MENYVQKNHGVVPALWISQHVLHKIDWAALITIKDIALLSTG